MVKKYYKKSFYKKSDTITIKDSKYLIIVESPSKCKKIESFLGEDYTCIASKGHIRSIDGLSSIDENYNIKYSIIEDKKEHVEWMRAIIDKYDHDAIYLATDDDREGEGIAWHICDVFGFPVETMKRILFHEITEHAIKKAVNNPCRINMNKVKAQQERQVLDILVGYRISPLLWKYLYRNKENSLSAGRCQTPALRLVYENEMEAAHVKVETKYKVKASFYSKNIEFGLEKPFETKEEVLEFLQESKTHSHKMTIGKRKEVMKQPPKPFSTSTLLQSASSNLHMSPKETMNLCQELYQDGYITYMRTESQTYSEIFLQEAKTYIREHFDESLGENIMQEDTENPHEAIRVTNIEMKTISKENGRANTLYKWIWKNTVTSCMPIAKFHHTPIYITSPRDLSYEHIIETPISLGWKKVDEKSDVLKEQTTGSALLLYIQSKPSENIPYNTIDATISIHGKHHHYTEASLIQRLEDLGIGRPSTFATIVDTIIERGYVEKKDINGTEMKFTEYVLEKGDIKAVDINKMIGNEKAKLRIQPLGILVSDFVTEHFNTFFAYDYTKNMENKLDEIANGNESFVAKTCDQDIQNCIKAIKTIEKPTFPVKNSDEFVIVYERYGPVLRKVLEDGSYHYENIRQNLEMDKLRSGEYSLEEILRKDELLGEHEGYPVLLKSGPYGEYISYKNETTNISSIQSDISDGGSGLLDGFIKYIKAKSESGSQNIIRELTKEISIRNGKYGAYIFYQTEKMKKPKFFNLNNFKESYKYCSEESLLKWIKEKHNIS